VGGIVGKLSFDRRVQLSPATLQRMLDAVSHRSIRASNCRATYLGHGIALGTCDDTLSWWGQTARNESGTVRVVADAELSNAARLRDVLTERGHALRGPGHAELIAHAYEEWGDACVEHFTGAFACAIWDDLQRRLLLARDQFGIRPLCFALLHADGVVFASEMKALLRDPVLGREWNPEAVDAYLACGYVPGPITLHPRISKLEPAHTLVVQGRRLTTRRYWEPVPDESSVSSENETADRLERCLGSAIDASSADGDSCVLLSGGIASTTLGARASRHCIGVTIGIDGDRSAFDAVSHLSAQVGRRSEFDEISLNAVESAALLARHFDEPIADPAAVAHYAVFAAARRHAAAALTGIGARALWSGSPPAAVFDDQLRQALYTRRFVRSLGERGGHTAVCDARTWLADCHLAAADRAATAAGLQLRHPYLDTELADLAAAVADEMKGPRGQMLPVRRIAERHVPAVLLDRCVGPARAPWLREALHALVPHVLLGDRFEARGIVSRPAIRVLWDEYQAGGRDHTLRLWSLLVLELWCRECYDDDAGAQPLESGVLVRAA
jgi:asparagine synthase (glutamine-hydrolysing)